jgi:hypothetical protein
VLAGWWGARGPVNTAVQLAVNNVGKTKARAHQTQTPKARWPIGKVIVPA